MAPSYPLWSIQNETQKQKISQTTIHAVQCVFVFVVVVLPCFLVYLSIKQNKKQNKNHGARQQSVPNLALSGTPHPNQTKQQRLGCKLRHHMPHVGQDKRKAKRG